MTDRCHDNSIDGPPRVDPPVIVEKAGAPVVLDYLNAVTSGRTVKRFSRRGQFHISRWTGPVDQASWRVHFLQPGRYRIHLVYAGAPGRPTGGFVLSADDREVQVESPQASDWYQYVSLDAGVLDVAAAGEQELVLRPAREIGQDVMCFKSLKLERLPCSAAYPERRPNRYYHEEPIDERKHWTDECRGGVRCRCCRREAGSASPYAESAEKIGPAYMKSTLTFFTSLLLTTLSASAEPAAIVVTGESRAPGGNVERIGPTTFYAAPVERYRVGAPDVNNPAYYPIPRTAVTRATYMAWLEQSGLLDYAQQPKLGMSGPTLLLPALAKYVQTGERHWGEACIAMLQDYHRAMEAEVKAKGWVEQFAEPPAFLPVYRKHLIAGGLMTPDEPWFKELWLYYCRNLHVWGTKPIEWRGPCHRSMPEALAKGLAAKWYPDISEAAHWTKYSGQVWQDFWRVKDLLQNDTGYFQDSVRAYAFSSDQLLGDDRYLSDPGMQMIWERLMAEITPDGAINPYGPNGGWNSTAALRVGVLERVAAATGNGVYRIAAHKAMNYLLYQNSPTLRDQYLKTQETAPYIVLAWLVADDSIQPVEPPSGGLATQRREPARYPHRDKAIVGRFLPDLDPDPDKANLCCNWTFTERTIPDKLILRSGWHPGDFFVLVELAPTTFPYNAGGILGMNRWGAPFTQVVTSKGDTPENRLWVTDLSGKARRRYLPDPDRINEVWEQGKMQDMMTSVPFLRDTPNATFARVEMQNPEGLPVQVIQEYIFVKNRFLARRETVVFEEAFDARVAAIWNTQNIGPQIGSHWANTFINAPVASNGQIAMNTPPADLLVHFAPQPGWRMQVVDRTAEDPRTEVCPAQVRYVWEGTPSIGQRLHSTQVYYPHAARKAPPVSNNPGAKNKDRSGEFAALAGASAIQVVRDDLEATVLRFEFEPGRVEWVVFNPQTAPIQAAGLETTVPLAYIDEGRP